MSCDSTHLQRHIMPLGVIFLNCCVTDLRNKQVINQRDGNILGPVSDIEVDTCSGKVVAIIVFGRPKCMGLFGRCDDIRICWEDIKVARMPCSCATISRRAVRRREKEVDSATYSILFEIT